MLPTRRSARLGLPLRLVMTLAVVPAYAVAQDAAFDRYAGRQYCLSQEVAQRSTEWHELLCLHVQRPDVPGVELPEVPSAAEVRYRLDAVLG